MKADDQKRVEKILFENLSEIADPGDRGFFLDWVCRDNSALKTRMARLLESEDQAERFFDFAPFETCDPNDESAGECEGEEEIGLRIGKYRLLRRLGEGGCGVVYLAEQESPVRRKVALKLIRVGLDHAEASGRFDAERQSLAMMDHPGIARVLDAGATITGRPFFVMQWVSGERITEFCDKQLLNLRQRLELFVRVCHAIQHAHQKGVIHRDIKPSNILVYDHDGTPLPKVIDFGIAKSTGCNKTDSGMVRDYFLGTPKYMSPEQAMEDGAAVDTRSDIFSLGVLLCELVAGSTPFVDLTADISNPGAVRDILVNRQASPPSEVFGKLSPAEKLDASNRRGTNSRNLEKSLVGDLDAIVLKCVSRDPQSRYNTAHSLAVDVQHLLSDEPVGAYPSSRSYRFMKLVRRNKFTFISGALIFFTLAIGFGTSTVMFLREKNARSEQARLRIDAEQARTAESHLRERAEARELCTQAAVRLMYGEMDEADEIAARIPENLVPTSLEATDLFGKLGTWHVTNGRWIQASRCFSSVVESFASVDLSDTDNVSRNLLPAVAAACEAGDVDRYERLRRIAIQRFGGSHHPVVAEQIIKVCLLCPADSEMIAKVQPLAKVIEASSQEPDHLGFTPNLHAWAHFSMALWCLRTGEPEQSVEWSIKSLKSESLNPSRVASVELVLAMAHFRKEEPLEARRRLKEAQDIILPVFQTSIGRWSTGREGPTWPDWANAHMLLKEAEALIGPPEE